MILTTRIIPVLLLIVLAAATLVVNTPPATISSIQAAQADYFLKIEGIEGESDARNRQGEIEILSWSWGETSPGVEQVIAGVGRAGASQPEFADISVKAYLSKASPKIMEAVATGQHIPVVILTGLRQGQDGSQEEYLKITLTDVLISSYQTGGSQSEPLPIDNFSFNYEKIEYEYTPQKSDGTADSPVKAGYDLKKNQKI
jgi:type VI secretion system secreted protein Hcp